VTIIDAHQHVWDPTTARYDWLTQEYAPINRPIAFDALRPSLRRAGVQATVLVQSADNDDDTELMLGTAQSNPEIVAVVAYVPLDRPERAAERLAELQRNPIVAGVRNLIHDIPDPDWLLRPEVDDGLGVLESAGATFDLVSVLPRHLELVPLIVERHPRLKIVIDHLSKPPIGLAERDPWWQLIARAAEAPLVHAKISGLYSATADSGSWTPELVRPFFDRAIEVFGADRLMYGSDWPICELSGGYHRVWDGLSELFDELDAAERQSVLGGTAERFYAIGAERLADARELQIDNRSEDKGVS
jgi:L-fuconolactonase